MTGNRNGDEPATINSGPTPQERREEDQEFDAAGNVKVRGEDPSPDDRERGEISGADKAPPAPRR